MNTDIVRHQLETIVGPVPEKRWAYLVEERYVEEVLSGESTLDDLAEAYRRLAAAFGEADEEALGPRKASPRKTTTEADRLDLARSEVLSLHLAREAAKEEEVKRFRDEHLGGKLLRYEEVEGWIRERAKQDGPATSWLDRIPVPADHEVEHGPKGWFVEPPLTLSHEIGAWALRTELLAFETPDSEWVHHVPTAAYGVLGKLHRLSETLERRYGWTKSQATMFVLTGVPPWVPSIRVTKRTVLNAPVLGRIELSIDPVMTPKQVAAAYSRVRSNYVGKRQRSLTLKHVRLAGFTMSRQEDEPWAVTLEAWNKEYPQWSYGEQLSNFKRDALKAQQRLVQPEYRIVTKR